MLVRVDVDRYEPVAGGLTFSRWMAEGHHLRYPTLEDFAYHLTTLFPPVRPKGWLELRMIDAVPDPWWRVAVAVTTALLDDPKAFHMAERTCRAVADCWADRETAAITEAFVDRYVDRGRSPADDTLDALRLAPAGRR